jgi:hypothetical protein
VNGASFGGRHVCTCAGRRASCGRWLDAMDVCNLEAPHRLGAARWPNGGGSSWTFQQECLYAERSCNATLVPPGRTRLHPRVHPHPLRLSAFCASTNFALCARVTLTYARRLAYGWCGLSRLAWVVRHSVHALNSARRHRAAIDARVHQTTPRVVRLALRRPMRLSCCWRNVGMRDMALAAFARGLFPVLVPCRLIPFKRPSFWGDAPLIFWL